MLTILLYFQGIQANTMSPLFDYRVEEQQENGGDMKIIIEAVINQELNRETVGFTYTFDIEEFIAEGQCPLKDDLLSSFISTGISSVASSIIHYLRNNDSKKYYIIS